MLNTSFFRIEYAIWITLNGCKIRGQCWRTRGNFTSTGNQCTAAPLRSRDRLLPTVSGRPESVPFLADKRTSRHKSADRSAKVLYRNSAYSDNALRYGSFTIKNLHSGETEQIRNGVRSKRLPQDIQQIARRKLRMLNNARSLNDLRIPPANQLEALKGSRSGQHSIRINDQWRICFEWMNGDTENVEVVDYH